MCEITACILKGKQEEKVLESVEKVEVSGDIITLVNLFGEEKSINAKFKSYHADSNKMIFEPF
jgi:predicted RNA-binding protein